MNLTLEKIKSSRPDLSDYLFHFTKGAKAASTLDKILSDKEIKDISKKGFICFTETPLYALIEMFEIFEGFHKPLYAPYGVAIQKEEFYKIGGRPVIYGPKTELKFIDKSIHWRYEVYNSKKNFTWLREWRINQNSFKLNANNCFIVTKSIEEAMYSTHDVGDIEVGGDLSDGQWWPSYTQKMEREWKSISIEEILDKVITNRSKLKSELDQQKLGEQ